MDMPVKQFAFLDRYLTPRIFIAIAAGNAIGYFSHRINQENDHPGHP